MKYFLDVTFNEYSKQSKACGIKIGKPIPTIGLISIGIVSENIKAIEKQNEELRNVKTINFIPFKESKDYYAVCKEFNVKDAWNKYTEEINVHFNSNIEESTLNPHYIKKYWIREDILRPIYDEFINKYLSKNMTIDEFASFDFQNFKTLLRKYGKSKRQIILDIIRLTDQEIYKIDTGYEREKIEFYSYHSDYHWIAFSQLFGESKDLPNGFPKYCKCVKQIADETFFINDEVIDYIEACRDTRGFPSLIELQEIFCDNDNDDILNHKDYPKQEHFRNSLDYAQWTKKLFNFLDYLSK